MPGWDEKWVELLLWVHRRPGLWYTGCSTPTLNLDATGDTTG